MILTGRCIHVPVPRCGDVRIVHGTSKFSGEGISMDGPLPHSADPVWRSAEFENDHH